MSLNIVLLFNNSESLAVSLSSLSISFSLHLFPSSYFLRILAENTNCIFGDRLAYADEKKQPQHLCGLKQEFTFCLSYELGGTFDEYSSMWYLCIWMFHLNRATIAGKDQHGQLNFHSFFTG